MRWQVILTRPFLFLGNSFPLLLQIWLNLPGGRGGKNNTLSMWIDSQSLDEAQAGVLLQIKKLLQIWTKLWILVRVFGIFFTVFTKIIHLPCRPPCRPHFGHHVHLHVQLDGLWGLRDADRMDIRKCCTYLQTYGQTGRIREGVGKINRKKSGLYQTTLGPRMILHAHCKNTFTK